MRNLIKAGCMALVRSLGLAAPVAAAPVEDGVAAFARGDYATALRLFRPLAEQGNASAQFHLGEALLMRLHLGRLHGLKALAPELAAQVKAVWVGRLIEAVDDVFLEGADLKLFKDCYGWLSEFCHPNSFARQVVGMRFEGRTVRFDRAAGLTVEEVGTALDHAGISHELFFMFFDEVAGAG